jgi:hypothetical protein
VKPLLLIFSLSAVSFAQSATPAADQNGGVTAAWDLRKDMSALAEQTRKLQPLLARVKAEEWVARGAPDAYAKQLKSAQSSVEYAVRATEKLAQQPEKLSVALEAFFRIQAMEALLESLRTGIDKYQDGKLSQEINIAMADNSNNRDKLRLYIADLAATREQEFQILDQEAQRCRGALIRQAPPAPPARTKKLEKK